jgi:hypothetical protein
MEKKASGNNAELVAQNKDAENSNIAESLHKIIAEVIQSQGEKILVKAIEGNRSFWVQAPMTDLEIGESYFFKENPNSLKVRVKDVLENQIIDTLYVVNSLVPAKHGMMHHTKKEPPEDIIYTEESLPRKVMVDGSISIAELVKNAEKYENKTVQISGECTKVNYNIMGRNWIHLKDGSQDDFDLVVTSEENPSTGQILTMQGVVIRDKDFGAGYQYSLILEQGKILKHN